MPKKEYIYNVTFRVWNGWQYNDPKYFKEQMETFFAENQQQAFEAARIHAADTAYWKEKVTIRKKDVVRADRDPRWPEFPAQFSAKEILELKDKDNKPDQIEISIVCDRDSAADFLHELADVIQNDEDLDEEFDTYETEHGCAEIITRN